MSLEIEVSVPSPPTITVTVEPGGAQGPPGADSTVPGPTAVSADADNIATLGSDDLIFVPASGGGGGAWGSITGTLADQTDLDAALDAKSDDGHTHVAADVTDFNTAADARVVAGITGKSDTGHTHTASNVTDFNTAADARVVAGITGKLDTSAAPELIRDTIGTALVAGTNVTITVNDGSDTITIDATGGGASAPEVRHDSDDTYSYMGSAPDGTAEGSSGWDVTRITLTSPPVIETGTGTWTGRAGLTYS